MTTKTLHREHHGSFLLTNAVRPGPGLPFEPRTGYRLSRFHDAVTETVVPMLVASVSREGLFDCFMELVELLGPTVNVILETSHDTPDGDHCDLERDGIDLPVLLSQFCDHEQLLLDDGCTGVAVMDEEGTMEVQFDEHKILVVYGDDLDPFIDVLRRHGVPRDEHVQFLTETEHLHSSSRAYREQFEQFAMQLGVAEMTPTLNW